MTTIIAWKGKDFVSMASDSQVTAGNLSLPIDYDKIERIGDRLIVGGSGSVGNLQNILARAKTNVIFQKLNMTGGEYAPIGVSELARELADLNFTLPLEYKHWSGFSYIAAGQDADEENRVYAIGDDGSRLEVQTFWADGSGSQLAMSLLDGYYDVELPKEQVGPLLAGIITSVSQRDVFTGWKPKVWTVSEGMITVGSITNTKKGEVAGDKEVKEESKPEPVKEKLTKKK